MTLRAELLLFSRSLPQEIIIWGYVKSLLPPAAAKDYFVRHIIFMISRSEIMKMMCLTKHNSARSAVKNLFTQPRTPLVKNDFRHNPGL